MPKPGPDRMIANGYHVTPIGTTYGGRLRFADICRVGSSAPTHGWPLNQMPSGTVAADISVAVIHDRARRSCTARRREVVNNCAAGENFAGERPAPARSQSQSPHPKRVIGRLLAEPEALAPTSHRKRPQERPLYQLDGRQGKATQKPTAATKDHE